MRGKHLGIVLATLARNGALVRVELGFLISTVVEWAFWLALVVIAYDRGGAAEAGLIGFAVGLPAIVVAPTAAILGDRWPRSRVMLATYVAQAIVLVAAAAAFVAGAPLLGYGLGVFASALGFLVQTWAQRQLSAARTALAFAMEPVWTAIFGFWLAGDRLGALGWTGAALIMAGIVVAEPAAADALRRLLRR